MLQIFRRRDRGFTLIELLVVIAIIGLLSSIVLVAVGPARVKARDARRQSDVRQVNLAMEMCYDDSGCNASEKYIDTAAAIFATSQVLGKIVWSGMSDNAVLDITDADGNVIYHAEAGLDNDYFEFDFNGWPSTLTVATIDSGVLLIYPYLP